MFSRRDFDRLERRIHAVAPPPEWVKPKPERVAALGALTFDCRACNVQTIGAHECHYEKCPDKIRPTETQRAIQIVMDVAREHPLARSVCNIILRRLREES